MNKSEEESKEINMKLKRNKRKWIWKWRGIKDNEYENGEEWKEMHIENEEE